MVDHLQGVFIKMSKKSLFLRHVPIPDPSRQFLPPYLRPSFACLGACMAGPVDSSFGIQNENSPANPSFAIDLFQSASKLWGVTLESDNRESRKIHCVVAVSKPVPAYLGWRIGITDADVQNCTKVAILMTFGFLSTDGKLWSDSSAILGYTGEVRSRNFRNQGCLNCAHHRTQIARRLHVHDYSETPEYQVPPAEFDVKSRAIR